MTVSQHPRFAAPWLKPVRVVMARPRLFTCALLGGLTYAFLPMSLAQHEATRLIIAPGG
jgi:hypothetical protein